MKKVAIAAAVACAIWAVAAFPYAAGPDPRYTAAPGDASNACSSCHGGSPNTGPGSVTITFPGATYTPGAKHRIQVQVSDAGQRRWGFQFTARLASDAAQGQAGDLTPVDNFTQVICENAFPQPCPAGQPILFIEHTSAGTRNGAAGGVTFEFDWTAPGEGAGTVNFYAAGNAANGDANATGDLIYTTSLQVDPAPPSSGGGGSLVTPTAYAQHNLVSDLPDLADRTDSNLINPWGIALNAAGPFRVSNNRSGTGTAYNGAGEPFPVDGPRIVQIPPPAGGAGARPTAQVYNPTGGFEVDSGKPATFLFATADGAIAGWSEDADAGNAITVVDNSPGGAVYTGLAIGIRAGAPALYAANFAAGTVEVFDAAFKPLATAGGFQDPDLPSGFAPFNIQRFGSRLFVTYAQQDDARRNAVPGAGAGHINVFDLDGNLRQRLISGADLNAPWGLALASGFFGDYSHALLVANSGDGTIRAFDPAGGESLGTLAGQDGAALVVEGLRAIVFGNGRDGGDANALYFTAGISGGAGLGDHGLFGAIQVVR